MHYDSLCVVVPVLGGEVTIDLRTFERSTNNVMHYNFQHLVSPVFGNYWAVRIPIALRVFARGTHNVLHYNSWHLLFPILGGGVTHSSADFCKRYK